MGDGGRLCLGTGMLEFRCCNVVVLSDWLGLGVYKGGVYSAFYTSSFLLG